MQDLVATYELQFVIGSDGIVRVNVDDVCVLRVRCSVDDIRLIGLACYPDRLGDTDTFQMLKVPTHD